MRYAILLFILCFATPFVIFYENIKEATIDAHQQINTRLFSSNRSAEEYSTTPPPLFDTCPLPHQNPFEKEFIKALGKAKDTIKCIPEELLTTMKDGKVVRNEKYNGSELFECEAKCLFYVSNYENKGDEFENIEKRKEYNCDVIEVRCKMKNATWTYSTLHTQIKEYSRDRLKEFGPLGVDTKTPKITPNHLHPDVYMIILDAMAMSSMMRQMPETVVFLEEALEAVPMRHVAKVAENSKPNAFAMLMGEIPISVDRSVYGYSKILPPTLHEGESCDRPLDNETYIQFEYEDAGYKTMYACDYNLVTFGYTSCKGITNKLATHYMRPFQTRGLHAADELLKKTLFNAEKCRSSYDYLMDYQEKFIQSYKGIPKMSLIWSVTSSHDTEKTMKQQDRKLAELLERNFETFDNSFVIVLGDHGPRYDYATLTKQGQFDRANPLMFLSLPRKLRGTEMHRIVEQNSKQLSSHHDLHATLADIIRHQPQTNFTDTSYKNINGSYGSSWLRQFESGKPRSCRSLPIPAQYCICEYGQKEVTDKPLIEQLGKLSIDDINMYLKERKVDDTCENMELKEVSQVQSVPVDGYKARFRVHLKTKREANVVVTYIQSLNGTIQLLTKMWDRLDRYGTTADCVTAKDFDLRILCYCKEQKKA